MKRREFTRGVFYLDLIIVKPLLRTGTTMGEGTET